MKYQVTHTTVYSASNRVSVCHNAAWLTPRQTAHQQCADHDIVISPAPSTEDCQVDGFGNRVTLFSFNEGYKELRVTAKSRVAVSAPPPVPDDSPGWESIREQLAAHETPEDLDALQFRFDSPRSYQTEAAAEYARESFTPERPALEAIIELTTRIHADFAYDSKATTVTTPITQVLETRRGVCQDFAHVQIAMLRSLGLAARYVSGYIRTYPPAGRPRLVGADASHAWLSLYCGELGWVDVDPTNNKFAGEEYVTVAWGRDYGDVSPLKGIYTGGGKHKLDVSVDMAPLENGAS